MLRIFTLSLLLAATGGITQVYAVDAGDAPPVLMPESPPALPSPSPEAEIGREHAHSHSLALPLGPWRPAPADQPPSLVAPGNGAGSPRSSGGLGPRGGTLVPWGDGHQFAEVLYDETQHAVTIFLPSPHGGSAHRVGGDLLRHAPYECEFERRRRRASSHCPHCGSAAYAPAWAY